MAELMIVGLIGCGLFVVPVAIIVALLMFGNKKEKD
jgi:hypothetical protein